MKKQATASPAYRKFVHDRDVALEAILNRSLMRMSDALGSALSRVEDAAYSAAQRMQDNFFTPEGSRITSIFENKMDHAFGGIYAYTIANLERLSRNAYLLSYVGETEAIARATHATLKYQDRKNPDRLLFTDNQPLTARVEYLFVKLKQRIMNAFRLASLQELEPSEFVEKVIDAFPKKRSIPTRKTILRDPKLREADQKPKADYSSGFIDDAEWQQIVDDYLAREIPTYPFRTPENASDKYYIPSRDEEVYVWEMEQEAIQSFVDDVRSGQVQAANDQGIKDFVWIAILDDRTDECCSWRDGLTVSEIESRLKTDKRGDECDAVTPPAHFNCRCSLAPITENVQEIPPPDAKEFDEWLLS